MSLPTSSTSTSSPPPKDDPSPPPPLDTDTQSQSGSSSSSTSTTRSPLILYRPPTVMSILRTAAINLVLPFINGLMLGFGELFAHELAFRLGWSGTRVFPIGRRTLGPGAGAGAVGNMAVEERHGENNRRRREAELRHTASLE